MKTLCLFRHSIKDGPDATIGPKGLQLAWAQGERLKNLPPWPRFIFHGPQAQNINTALATCQGLGHVPIVMPTVLGLGNDALFAEIITEDFKRTVAGGVTNFEAIRIVHGDEKTLAWGAKGHGAIVSMFQAMEEGQKAIGFFYGIPIELAAWHCADGSNIPVMGWNELREIEGLVFRYDKGKIRVAEKICAPPTWV